MKQTYFLGIDAAKHKMRVALSARDERVLFEKDLPVNATGLRELLATIKRQVNDPQQLLVLIEATGLLHLNWSAANVEFAAPRAMRFLVVPGANRRLPISPSCMDSTRSVSTSIEIPALLSMCSTNGRS